MAGIKDFLFDNSYAYLLQIAIILLATKLLGLVTKRISLPQVVGALAAGIILGPMLLDVVERNSLISNLAELGVIVLMFSAGLETDLQELKKAGNCQSLACIVCHCSAGRISSAGWRFLLGTFLQYRTKSRNV